MADDRTPDIEDDEDDDDDFSDLPPGRTLKPTHITPELRKSLDEAKERMMKKRSKQPRT